VMNEKITNERAQEKDTMIADLQTKLSAAEEMCERLQAQLAERDAQLAAERAMAQTNHSRFERVKEGLEWLKKNGENMPAGHKLSVWVENMEAIVLPATRQPTQDKGEM
jgi:septal ring factor EnvC (AmiA/AmiB activator)